MLRFMRRGPCQTGIVALTTVLMVAVVTVPGFLALAPEGGPVNEDWLVERFSDQPDDVMRAIESALDSGFVSVDQFVDAFLDELNEMDRNAVEDILAQVLPRMSLERFLNAGWLVDLRVLVKSDRSPSARDIVRVIPKLAVLQGITTVGVVGSARNGWSTGSKLTRWQIRHLISALPLGP